MGAVLAKEIESKINPVNTVPETRSPVQDGASGLHYSGRVYANQFQQLSSDICKGASASITQIGDVMPNSISTTTLATDPSTKRISQPALQSYVQALMTKGQIPGQLPDFNKQMAADTAFYAQVQTEYCFYESRYSAALNHFLTLIADPHTPDTSTTLAATVNLNKRLNSLLEIMNYVSDNRANMVNIRSHKLNTVGQTLNEKIAILQSQQDFLQKGDVMRKTQDEMMRYSAEKSDATNIQIALFVALNIVAIGAVLTVYRQVKTTV
jgi:paraquat-inducible protein B